MFFSKILFYSAIRWLAVGMNLVLLLGGFIACTADPELIWAPELVLLYILSAATIYVLFRDMHKGALRIICLFVWWGWLIVGIYGLIGAVAGSSLMMSIVGCLGILISLLNLVSLYKLPLLSTKRTTPNTEGEFYQARP